jgi:dihydrofolate synthase/folylpolyglutamate synthase
LGLPAPVDLGDLLEPFASRGVDLGLDRLAGALAAGGHPERRFAAVQVAGTNGKGSICTFLAAILAEAGLAYGVYRSPHLLSWCERLQLGERWITAAELRADLGRWRPIAEAFNLTPFELLTAAAFDRLATEAVQLAILEVGLGGRLDATSLHPARRVIGLAAIGLDHCEVLGSTLEASAFETAGACQPGAIAISAPQDPAVAAVLTAQAQRLGTELCWVEPLPPEALGGPRLGLAGDLQRRNGAVAVGMAQALGKQGWAIGAGAIGRGLARARWPGRLEIRSYRGQPLLLDGAHNPPAATALRQELDLGELDLGDLDRGDRERRSLGTGGPGPLEGCGRRWLLGIQRHKQGAAMVRALLAPGDQAAITPLPEHASWSAAELAVACPELASQLRPVADPVAGLAWLHLRLGPEPGAGELASPEEGSSGATGAALPVVAGSLYLLGALIPWLDPAAAGPG